MGTIHQGGWYPTTGDGNSWRDGDWGAVALRSTACIKVVIARIIGRRIPGQDHAHAGWNRERAPEVEYLAPGIEEWSSTETLSIGISLELVLSSRMAPPS